MSYQNKGEMNQEGTFEAKISRLPYPDTEGKPVYRKQLETTV